MLPRKMEISICRIMLHQRMWKSVLSKGEALAVSWALDNAHLFVLRCPNIIFVTNHKPLLGICKDRELNTIPNPRLQSLKEKTLAYCFTMHYYPGKWHWGPDAVFCHPVHYIIASYDPSMQRDLNHVYVIENQTK